MILAKWKQTDVPVDLMRRIHWYRGAQTLNFQKKFAAKYSRFQLIDGFLFGGGYFHILKFSKVSKCGDVCWCTAFCTWIANRCWKKEDFNVTIWWEIHFLIEIRTLTIQLNPWVLTSCTSSQIYCKAVAVHHQVMQAESATGMPRKAFPGSLPMCSAW